MPRSLILHIGTMKTGSTMIQTLLTYNRAALRTRGICYAAAGGINNHMLLALTFCSRPQIQNGTNGSWWSGRDPSVGRRETCEQFAREMEELPPEVNRVRPARPPRRTPRSARRASARWSKSAS